MGTHAGLKALSRQSVVEAAVEQLQLKILRGDFRPGDKLPTEAELTEALGVSRSTLREALSRLASLRLIHVQHGGSKTILDYREHAGLEIVPTLLSDTSGHVDVDVVRSITELRAILAPDAARLAARRRTEANAERLIHAAAAMAEAALDLDELSERANYFWKQLILSSGNLAYRLAFNSLQTAYLDHAPQFRKLIAPELQAASAYQGISQAVVDGDADLAKRRTQELVAVGDTIIMSAIEAYTSQQGGE